MPDFTNFTDEQILGYLAEHCDELEAGVPPDGFPENLRRGMKDGQVSIEKRTGAFAIVAHANRKHRIPFVQFNPQADLKFLYVAPEARAKGVGSELLREVKLTYMEDQGMELVCAGLRRKAFFERAGFVAMNTTEQGLYYMWCDPLENNKAKKMIE